MGMMFWYGIEQLFMDYVLADPSARALSTLVFTGTWLVFDIPGGIVADNFGRRKTLILSAALQTVGVGVLAGSNSLPIYLLGAFLYGLHWSTFSGIVQALMYDHLLESGKHRDYSRHQGAVTAFGYIGAGIANILSGLVADMTNLRMPYILSIVPSLFALGLALSLHETKRAVGQHERRTLRQYFTELAHTIKKTPLALAYVIQIVSLLFVMLTVCEFGQVFLLSFHISATTLGFLWALDAGLVALGLHLAHRLQRWSWQTLVVYIAVLLSFVFVQNPIAILLFMLVYTGNEIVHNIAETELQHVTASHSRATVLSSVTFVGNLLALPLILVFNSLYLGSSLYVANRLIGIGVAVLLAVALVVSVLSKRKKVI